MHLSFACSYCRLSSHREKENLTAKGYWKRLHSDIGFAQLSIILPTIQAIVDVCKPFLDIMVQVQASKYPRIHIVTPRIIHASNTLLRISNGCEIRDVSGVVCLSFSTRMKLATLTFKILKEKLLCHPIYVGSILVHPLLENFDWVADTITRDDYFK